MKHAFLFSLVLVAVTACGTNISTKSSSNVAATPAQRLLTAESGLLKIGITFNSDNALSGCSSLHLPTCNNQLTHLNDYVNKVFDMYESEDLMPADYQQRLKSVIACETQINADIKNTAGPNCQH